MPQPAHYLAQCLKNDRLVRWADKAMPLPVHIAPFTWYEKHKQQHRYQYIEMVRQSFETWAQHSQGAVKFVFVTELRDSLINLVWRRVDRNTLGHCTYEVNPSGEIFTAEISIGLTDGKVHPGYDSMDEVRHTVVHEIAHALGIAGHSEQQGDIMYVPHQYGIAAPSARDIATLQTLYRLPVGFDYKAVAQQLKLPTHTHLNATIQAFLGEVPIAELAQPVRPPLPNRTDVLLGHQDLLTQINQFYVQTQHVQVRKEVKHLFVQPKPTPFQPPLAEAAEVQNPQKPILSPPSVPPLPPPTSSG
jgi:hypothetical protein